MKAIKLFSILIIVVIFYSCKSNDLLHRDIKKENFDSIYKCSTLKDFDSVWLNRKTVCVKTSDNFVKIGSVKRGKEQGKWYYYHVSKDTIDCYFIEDFQKNDTVKTRIKTINRRYL